MRILEFLIYSNYISCNIFHYDEFLQDRQRARFMQNAGKRNSIYIIISIRVEYFRGEVAF